jgi:hypothetical protein
VEVLGEVTGTVFDETVQFPDTLKSHTLLVEFQANGKLHAIHSPLT